MGAMAILAERLETNQEVEGQTLRDIIEFMRTFGDRCHHGKKDYFAFPMADKTLGPKDQRGLYEESELAEPKRGKGEGQPKLSRRLHDLFLKGESHV